MSERDTKAPAALRKPAAECDVGELIDRIAYRRSLKSETAASGWYDDTYNKSDLRRLRELLNQSPP